MDDNKFLSKKKYLYVAYPSSSGLTMERRTIAYINKYFVYLIVPGSTRLEDIPLSFIYDANDPKSLEEIISIRDRYIPEGMWISGMQNHNHYSTKIYFWDPINNFDALAKESLEVYKSYVDQYKIKDLEIRIEQKRIEYEFLLDQLEKEKAKYARRTQNERPSS